MKIMETGQDEFSIILSRAEATLLNTALIVAFEDDGRDETDYSKFAGDMAYVLHQELMPAIKHDCRCSVCRWHAA